jgi:type II secretory pathway component PulF
MANSMEPQQGRANRVPVEPLVRIMAMFASIGYRTASVLLAKVVPIFAALFKGLEVELPFTTRILVTHDRWISAWFLGGAVILPIVTEFLISATRRCLIISSSAFAASAASVGLVVFVLYLPVFELARKAGQAT